jgi:hypothetical protein
VALLHQGKHLPFSPSPLRLNIFRLFVILSLTQLYRYTPEIFLFSTATFKYGQCERPFSALRRLKQRNRTTMVEDRLSGLALLHIYREENVGNVFANIWIIIRVGQNENIG